MLSDALSLASDSINTPRDTLYQHHDVSRYMAPFLAVLRPFDTCVTKIGLIDLDDLTKEDPKHLRGTQHHLLHHRRKEIAEVTRQIALRSSQLAW